MVIALPGRRELDPRVATDAYGEQILQMDARLPLRPDGAAGPLPPRGPMGVARAPDVCIPPSEGLRSRRRPSPPPTCRYHLRVSSTPNRSPPGVYRTLPRSRPRARTVVFRLSEPFAPFLSTRPRHRPGGKPARRLRAAVGAGPLQDRRPLRRTARRSFRHTTGITAVHRRSAR